MKLHFILDKILIGCFFVLYIMYEIALMYPKQHIASFSQFSYILLLVVFLSYTLLKKWPWEDFFFRVFFLFEIIIYFLMVGHSLFNDVFIGTKYIGFIYPLFAFLFIYNLTIVQKNKNIIPWFMGGITIVFIIIFFGNENNDILEMILNTDSASYTALYLLPFALCIKNKWIRYIDVLAIFVTVALGFKRGGLICAVLGIYTYFFVLSFSTEVLSEKIKRLFFSIGGIIILGIAIYYVNEIMDGLIFNRFSMIEKTGGNGRNIIWQNTLEMISNSSIWSFLVGHGYNSVMYDMFFSSHLKYSAHNDFLECIYDFGFFAFAAYGGLYFFLVKKCIELVKNNSFYAAPLAASISMLLSNSMVSHIFFYEWHFMSFAMFWGFIHAAHRKEKELFIQQKV